MNRWWTALGCFLISIFGSYSDNLKITKPDEFDLVIRLMFPFHEYVCIEEDKVNHGNVFINLTEVINNIARQNQRKNSVHMYKFLSAITSNKGYLLQDRFQSWFEGSLVRYLTSINYELPYNKEKIFLRYIKQGPAHTIIVHSQYRSISIDFVPGFPFSKSKAVTPKKHLIETYDTWDAIPKPIAGKPNNPSFQTSYTDSERVRLIDRKQFKNGLRMMKKFRDMNRGLVNLKSYFIKTLFLFENDANGQYSWHKSNDAIMDKMFKVLESSLRDRKIRFFWDERVNMLRPLSSYQIDAMYHEVKNARKILSKRSGLRREDLQKIKNLFLTRREQALIPPYLNQEIETNFWVITTEATSSWLPRVIVAILVGAVLLSVFLYSQTNNN